MQLTVTLKPDAKAPVQVPAAATYQQSKDAVSSGQLQLHEIDSHVPSASQASRQAVMDLVAQHLSGLKPEEEGKYTIR